jgi:1,4-alpha-glucan branching enzyme
MQAKGMARRLPIGAELRDNGGVHFRVWAPRARHVDVVPESDAPAVGLSPEPDGYHAGVVEAAAAGTRYRFRLDGDRLLPDPASRFQPEGPHGPSCVVDASSFRWTDGAWRGIGLAGQVIYQGQRYRWQKKRRGTPTFGLPPATFVTFIQNHDQIANSARGHRRHLLTSPGRYKAVTALMLLGPGTPMLFQGQEFGASAPFLYFADHKPELARLVRRGRADFLHQFPALAAPEMQAQLPDPADIATFAKSKLDLSERERHTEVYALHADLLTIRREDTVFAAQRPGGLDGAVLALEAFVIRYFGGDAGDRLLLVNLARELSIDPAPEPLLAPPTGARWTVQWSSENPRYGGVGTPPIETDDGWHLPGESAIVMRSAPDRETDA